MLYMFMHVYDRAAFTVQMNSAKIQSKMTSNNNHRNWLTERSMDDLLNEVGSIRLGLVSWNAQLI